MRIMKFNEASSSKELDEKFFKAVYPDLIEDVKEILDITFIDFIDKGYDVNITKVNSKDSSFFTRYRIIMSYKLEEKEGRKLKVRSDDKTKIKLNTIENYSEIMRQVSEDLLDINNCYSHIKDEYDKESIFGNDFPKNEFDTSVKMDMSNGKLNCEFVLDIR